MTRTVQPRADSSDARIKGLCPVKGASHVAMGGGRPARRGVSLDRNGYWVSCRRIRRHHDVVVPTSQNAWPNPPDGRAWMWSLATPAGYRDDLAWRIDGRPVTAPTVTIGISSFRGLSCLVRLFHSRQTKVGHEKHEEARKKISRIVCRQQKRTWSEWAPSPSEDKCG